MRVRTTGTGDSRRHHYWLVTRDENGKPYLIYGGPTEEEARSKGLEVLGGMDFDIKRLPTRNLQAASSMIRGTRLEQTHSLKQASERIGHSRSLRRLKRKKIPPDTTW